MASWRVSGVSTSDCWASCVWVQGPPGQSLGFSISPLSLLSQPASCPRYARFTHPAPIPSSACVVTLAARWRQTVYGRARRVVARCAAPGPEKKEVAASGRECWMRPMPSGGRDDLLGCGTARTAPSRRKTAWIECERWWERRRRACYSCSCRGNPCCQLRVLGLVGD